MTEKEYRKLHRLSYSWLKLFMDDRLKYLEEFELAPEFVEKQESAAMAFGTLVDTLLLTPERFDERFENARFKRPTGHMGQFVNKLYELTLDNCNAEGEVSRSMTSLMEEAYNLVAYDADGDKVAFKRKSLNQVIAEFSNSDSERFYNQQREATHKHLVDVSDIGRANAVITKLRTHWRTKDIVNRENDARYSIHKQQIILFMLMGLEFKSMPDQFEIDHQEKSIQPYDLKITYEVEDFNYNYRKFRYYLQGLVYYLAISAWAKVNGYENYRIELPAFIVGHSSNGYDPLIWKMKRQNMMEALHGFSYRGQHYMGLKECIEDIKWHRSQQIWTMSRENYENQGICHLKTYAEYEHA